MSEQKIRMQVKALNIPFYIEFYDTLDSKTNLKEADAVMKRFIE